MAIESGDTYVLHLLHKSIENKLTNRLQASEEQLAEIKNSFKRLFNSIQSAKPKKRSKGAGKRNHSRSSNSGGESDSGTGSSGYDSGSNKSSNTDGSVGFQGDGGTMDNIDSGDENGVSYYGDNRSAHQQNLLSGEYREIKSLTSNELQQRQQQQQQSRLYVQYDKESSQPLQMELEAPTRLIRSSPFQPVRISYPLRDLQLISFRLHSKVQYQLRFAMNQWKSKTLCERLK